LEQLADGTEMEQVFYAESWLWVHFLLRDGLRRELLLEYLKWPAGSDQTKSMAQQLPAAGIAHQDLVDHLFQIAIGMDFENSR